jgi:hypothetical protein
MCETDYFRRLDLLCAKCGEALRGSYITSLNKKYHTEHFTCDDQNCDTVFGKDDSYWENSGKVYCKDHYSQYATLCCGCQLPILDEYFYDFEANKKWHPDCHILEDQWHMKASMLINMLPARTKKGWMDDTGAVIDQTKLVSLFETSSKAIHHGYLRLAKLEVHFGDALSKMQLAAISGNGVAFILSCRKTLHCFSGLVYAIEVASRKQFRKLRSISLFTWYIIQRAGLSRHSSQAYTRSSDQVTLFRH